MIRRTWNELGCCDLHWLRFEVSAWASAAWPRQMLRCCTVRHVTHARVNITSQECKRVVTFIARIGHYCCITFKNDGKKLNTKFRWDLCRCRPTYHYVCRVLFLIITLQHKPRNAVSHQISNNCLSNCLLALRHKKPCDSACIIPLSTGTKRDIQQIWVNYSDRF